ncbi:hypothetical protein RB614_10385 [Phytohabitans sp. ZYX-F-186]|uniref:CopC domain-containing protein n=1 Tax=Phytohabitans maris TaxID=3071409 RepID=A0ABU0ZD81_9ACTN|nr:hypothetical protein [Phytohabitans sp. ZYX-F-186]MDQ7904928.1 hypothetical protein [Phytohabitans sp. ZYX-F-186]
MNLAHAGAVLTVHSDGAGSVWVTAQWTDGHPVTGPASAILTATAAGQRVGPAPLRAIGDGAGTLTYSGQLPPGQWTVTAELAMPAVARCDARFEVGAAAAPAAVACTPPDSAAAPAGAAVPWPTVALAGAVVAVLVAGLLLARRRRRRTSARTLW